MFSADDLRRIVGAKEKPKHAEAVAKAAAKLFPAHDITDPREAAAVVASMGAETGFRILAESMSYSADRLLEVWPNWFTKSSAKKYARQPRLLANYIYGQTDIAKDLGNLGRPDAGWMYRGSGPGQNTGFDEFKAIEDATGIPVTSKPDLLRTDVELGVLGAIIFWKSKPHKEAVLAGDLEECRRLYNGGGHGLEAFVECYDRAIKILEEKGVTMSPAAASKEKTAMKNPKSAILPLFRPKQSDEITAAVMHKYEDLTPVDRRADPVKILVVRGYYRDSMGKKGANDRAIYDDACFVCSPDGVQPFNANSDPAVWRDRVATIKAEQAIEYKPGLHGVSRGAGYPAFRQHANCWVERDNARDECGMFYVNLHRGGSSGTSSEGCLTIPPHQWDEFHDLVTRLLKKFNQPTFFVTLVEYDGDTPPVTNAQIAVSNSQPSKEASDRVTGVAVVSIGLAVWGWWQELSTFIGGLF